VVCSTISKNGAPQNSGNIFAASIVPTSFIYSRPHNAKELFNLRHAQLRNVVERIFGIVKWCWSIFTCAQEYPIETQARFVSVIGALHNFICVHDAADDARDLAPDGPPSAAPLHHEDSVQDFVGDEPREIPEELGMDISAEGARMGFCLPGLHCGADVEGLFGLLGGTW
jgi:hypothetical protein